MNTVINLLLALVVRVLMAMGMPALQATNVRKLRPKAIFKVLFEAMVVAADLRRYRIVRIPHKFRHPLYLPVGGAAENDMIQAVAEFYDDFLMPFSSATNGLLASRCNYVLGTGTLTVTRTTINGGAATITGDTNEAGDVSLYGPLAYEPDECGLLMMQTRIRINGNGSAMTATSTFIGFVNANTNSLNLNYEDGAVVSTPTDGFGVVFEPEQNAGWYTIGVGNDVDDTVAIDTNIDSYVRATWVTIRIEAHNKNSAGETGTVVRYRVWIDGVRLETAATDANGWITSVARSAQTYAPVVACAGRATAYTTNVAELTARGGVGAIFD